MYRRFKLKTIYSDKITVKASDSRIVRLDARSLCVPPHFKHKGIRFLSSKNPISKQGNNVTNVVANCMSTQSCIPNALLSTPNLFFFSAFPTTKGAVLGGPISLCTLPTLGLSVAPLTPGPSDVWGLLSGAL